jgi:hypothetical protein
MESQVTAPRVKKRDPWLATGKTWVGTNIATTSTSHSHQHWQPVTSASNKP